VKVAAILTAMLLVCVNPLSSVSNAHLRLESKPQRTKTREVTTEFVVSEEVRVKTSAYYAPTRNQDGEYATGSFEGDVRLNGSGKVTKYKQEAPQEGRTIATDPKVFPPGTRLRLYDPKLPIEERVYYDFEAEDGGGSIKGRKIDIYMGRGKPALRKALKWGKKRMMAQVIEKRTREAIILAQR